MPSPPRRSLVEYRVGWQNDDGEKKERGGEEESKAGARPTSVVFIDASRPPMLLEAAPPLSSRYPSSPFFPRSREVEQRPAESGTKAASFEGRNRSKKRAGEHGEQPC